METLAVVHSVVRWLVLAALVAVAGIAFSRQRAGAAWAEGSDRPFALTTVLFDIQVALGIVLWIGTQAWADNLFIGVIHPLGMLASAGILHASVGRARAAASSASYRTILLGFAIGLVLVLLVIPWNR